MSYDYEIEDSEIVFHEEDPHLDTIRIPMPRLEDWYSKVLGRPVSREEALTYVDNYGLPPEKQKFVYQVMPQKLKAIYERVFEKKSAQSKTKYKDISDVTNEDLFEEIENNQKYYEDEIRWIKLQIKRGYLGYWCFIKGKPYYFTGRNYKFLNFWKVKNFGKNENRPDFREYQRWVFHAYDFFENNKEEYFRHRIFWRKDGKAQDPILSNLSYDQIKEYMDSIGADDYVGDFNVNIFKDRGKRTFHGINFVSGRRIAKTASACAYCSLGTIEEPDQTFIIQAMNEDQAIDKIFVKQIQTPMLQLPFFFMPHIKGKEDSKQGLNFQYDGGLIVAARAGLLQPSMECFIKPLTSNEKAADGEAEIRYVYRDEPAKKVDEKAAMQNIPTWWNNTMKPAISRGENIRGFCIMPSTVGDMDTGGGAQFFEIANDSHFLDRNENGVTRSGLVNIFLPGYYAVEGYIDEFGFSIVDDPKEPVLNNEGVYKERGAKTYLLNQERAYERKRDWKNLIKQKQNFPFTWADAFSVVPTDIGFPMEAMRDRISELRFSKTPLTKRVSLHWVGKKFGGDVAILDDPKGAWVMSYAPSLEHRNKRTIVSADEGYIPPPDKGNIYAPDVTQMGKFYLVCDPVKFHKHNTVGKKKSKAAATIYYKRDIQVDPDSKPRRDWVSNDFVMHYLEEVTDKNIYHEEWLKAAILYGAHIYPEWPDGEAFCEYLRDKGFDGYLLKDALVDGGHESRPGVYAGQPEKRQMFEDMMTFFTHNVRYMKHLEIIEEWTAIRGIDDLTNHDLCAASGWAMRAAASRMPEIFKEMYIPNSIEAGFDYYDVDD